MKTNQMKRHNMTHAQIEAALKEHNALVAERDLYRKHLQDCVNWFVMHDADKVWPTNSVYIQAKAALEQFPTPS